MNAHWFINDVDDLTIDGSGATLVFQNDAHGLVLRGTRRVRLRGLTLDWGISTAALGVIETTDDGPLLHLDRDASNVFFITTLRSSQGPWAQGAPRVILPPEEGNAAKRVGKRSFSSPLFRSLPVGHPLSVLLQWYGGNAVRVDDTPRDGQAEDVILERLTIHASPGMGVLAYGMRRGFALVDSEFVPRPNETHPVSVNYDALNVYVIEGDVLVARNRFTGSGDDAINLNSPVHPVVRESGNPRELVLGKYSRFIRKGDRLALFDAEAGYLGERKVEKIHYLGGLDHLLTVDSDLPVARRVVAVRTIGLGAGRWIVEDNVMERCRCHGVLAQRPNGLLWRNRFVETGHNAIRLLADLGKWYEGLGAINVAVRDNLILQSGWDEAKFLPWGAISAYGGAVGDRLTRQPVNRYLEIARNKILGARQGCITVAGSRDVVVQDNECVDTNQAVVGKPSIEIINSTVRLVGNRRAGTTTGGIQALDGTTQTGY